MKPFGEKEWLINWETSGERSRECRKKATHGNERKWEKERRQKKKERRHA